MTKLTTKNYAELAEDAYQDRQAGATLTLGDNKYKVLAQVQDGKTGYSGTIYQDISSRQIVIAHRGTEPNTAQDLFTDAKLVTHGVNIQLGKALEVAELAGKFANVEEQKTGKRPEVSNTGHSLGGTLSELISFYKNYPGHSFNAYGAVEIEPRITEGLNAQNFKAHYRVTDVVGTGGRHYGESIPYANERDEKLLLINGSYANTERRNFFDDWDRNPYAALYARGGGLLSHGIDNFIRSNEVGGPALLSTEARERAGNIETAVNHFTGDVRVIRAELGLENKSLVDLVSTGSTFVDSVKDRVTELRQSGAAGLSKLEEWGANIQKNSQSTWDDLRGVWPDRRTSSIEDAKTQSFNVANNPSYQNVLTAFNNSGVDPSRVDQRVILGLAADPKAANINFAGVSTKDPMQGYGIIGQSPSDPGAQRIDFNANGKSLEEVTSRLAQQTQPSAAGQIAVARPDQEQEQTQRKIPVMAA